MRAAAIDAAAQASKEGATMRDATIRRIIRGIHILFSIPIIGYIYSPFDRLPDYAPKTRYVIVPVMLLSGLWMWKGHLVRRLFARRPAEKRA